MKATKPERKETFISLRIEPSLLKRLNQLARRNERTLAGEIRLALRQHLDEAA